MTSVDMRRISTEMINHYARPSSGVHSPAFQIHIGSCWPGAHWRPREPGSSGLVGSLQPNLEWSCHLCLVTGRADRQAGFYR